MATLIEELPAFTTQDQLQEHQSATPASFNIAPILRRKVDNCNLVLRPNKIAGLSYAETGILGDLYVSEGALIFWSEALKKGLSVTYPTITLHAISRHPMKPWAHNDPEATDEADAAPNPESNGEHPEDLTSQQQGGACIFCQLDIDAQESDMDDEAYESTDLILTPPSEANIDEIFADFCHCASLFPSAMSDDGGEPALGLGQMDDAEDEEPEENETGASTTMTEADWDAKVDWSTAPAELQGAVQTGEQYEDAEGEDGDRRPSQGDAKKPRLG